MKPTRILLAVGVFLLLTGGVLAMSSSNYALDWFVPLTGSGGGPTDSSNYAANYTIGQSAIGAASSASYDGCLGYWCGAAVEYNVYLPLVLRNAP